uniref:hypothetical protein n=1 Tax=Tepidimonas taiwanensis TaxID=307486 RepID=UPI00137A0235
PPLWADGGLLLDALPIHAAIIESDDGVMRLSSHNNRFADAVAISSVVTLEGLSAQCLEGDGLVARHLQAWFADEEGARSDLDMRDGSGVSA